MYGINSVRKWKEKSNSKLRELAAADSVDDSINCTIVHVKKRGKQAKVPHITSTFVVLHIVVLQEVLMV